MNEGGKAGTRGGKTKEKSWSDISCGGGGEGIVIFSPVFPSFVFFFHLFLVLTTPPPPHSLMSLP